jgi:hypothetical protein
MTDCIGIARRAWRGYLAAALTLAATAGEAEMSAGPPGRVQTVIPLTLGGRVDWLPSGSLVTFDKLGDTDALSDVYVMRPNGADVRCLTCDAPQVPQGNNGNPAWHPSGRLIVFQAQNPSLPILPVEREPIANLATSPGWGTNHNLWIAMADGTRFWQLTNIAAGMAVLHPHFNTAGTRLVWSERVGFDEYPSEQWVMKTGAFRWIGGEPVLSGVQSLAPIGVDAFYETHGFSPDGRQLLFSAGQLMDSSLDIYLLDLISGELKNLTNSPSDYDEHAQFTPDGSSIVWASSRDITIPRQYFVPYLDYWVMRTDGTGRQRLTYFNQPGEREYYSNGIVCGDLTFGPDGWMLSKLEVGGIDPDLPIVEVAVLLR